MEDSKTIKRDAILVCVSDHPRMVMMLRMVMRKAKELGVGWRALHVETPDTLAQDAESQMRTLQNLTVAEHMGAEVFHIDAVSAQQGVQNFITQQAHAGVNFTCIYIGQTVKDTWYERLSTSLAEKLRKAIGTGIPVIIIELETDVAYRRLWLEGFWSRQVKWREVLYAMLAVVLATAMSHGLRELFPDAVGPSYRNRTVIYMFACAFIATRFGLVPGLITAVGSFLTLNMMFETPTDLPLASSANLLRFSIFLIATSLLAVFVSRAHNKAERLAQQVSQMQGLFRMYRVSLRKHTRHRTLEALHQELKTILKTEVLFFLPSAVMPEEILMVYPQGVALDPDSQAALRICWEEAKVTGYGASDYPHCDYRFKPLIGSSDLVGVMAIRIPPKASIDTATTRIYSGIADLVGLVLERLELSEMMQESRVREEREKLRSILLSSVSHDLKTPLASIIGSLGVFTSMSANLSDEQRATLIATALEEAQRLDSFISNILDMTKLESGQVRFRQEWVGLKLMVDDVRKRLRDRLRDHPLSISVASDASMEVYTDVTMMEQVIQNIVDNAVKYTPAGTPVIVEWEADAQKGCTLIIRDKGKGLPSDKISMVFDKYARLNRQDSQVAGTGLGLAIAKAVVTAQNGTIRASNHPEGGAMFTIILPTWRLGSAEKVA